MNKAFLLMYVHNIDKPRQMYMELINNYISMYTPREAIADSVLILSPLILLAPVLQNIQNSF